jgi:hypothetical protein
MAACGLTLDQRDASSLAGERDGSGTTCYTTTNDENFILRGNSILIRRSNWSLLFRTRYNGIVQLLRRDCMTNSSYDEYVI